MRRIVDYVEVGSTNSKGATNFGCSVVLITCALHSRKTRHILTAAHCGLDKRKHQVYLGTRKVFDNTHSIVLRIESIRTHPLYDKTTGQNDVAVVTLRHPPAPTEMRTEGVYPIRIQWDSETLATGTKVFALGIGVTVEHQNNAPLRSSLRNATLFRMDTGTCVTQHFPWADPAYSFCAKGAHPETACRGDSGGPLLRYKASTGTSKMIPYLLGVLSAYSLPSGGSPQDCLPGAAVLSQKVGGYKNWIEAVVGGHRRW